MGYQATYKRKLTTGPKKEFKEDPSKAVFITGLQTGFRTEPIWKQYRESIYNEIKKLVYIAKFDFPFNQKHAHLHVKHRDQVATLLSLSYDGPFDQIAKRNSSRMRVSSRQFGQTTLNIFTYRKKNCKEVYQRSESPQDLGKNEMKSYADPKFVHDNAVTAASMIMEGARACRNGNGPMDSGTHTEAQSPDVSDTENAEELCGKEESNPQFYNTTRPEISIDTAVIQAVPTGNRDVHYSPVNFNENTTIEMSCNQNQNGQFINYENESSLNQLSNYNPALICLSLCWQNSFSEWPVDEQYHLRQAFLNDFETYGPEAAIQLIASILITSKNLNYSSMEYQQCNF